MVAVNATEFADKDKESDDMLHQDLLYLPEKRRLPFEV
jgi:hypothetical protein